jgi:hypothetical protein
MMTNDHNKESVDARRQIAAAMIGFDNLEGVALTSLETLINNNPYVLNQALTKVDIDFLKEHASGWQSSFGILEGDALLHVAVKLETDFRGDFVRLLLKPKKVDGSPYANPNTHGAWGWLPAHIAGNKLDSVTGRLLIGITDPKERDDKGKTFLAMIRDSALASSASPEEVSAMGGEQGNCPEFFAAFTYSLKTPAASRPQGRKNVLQPPMQILASQI